MTTSIRYTAVAVFDDPEQASKAIAALRAEGFRDDQIGTGRKGLFGAEHDAAGLEGKSHARVDQDRNAAGLEVRRQSQHALGYAQIFGIAHQRDGLEGMGHDRSLVA